MKQNYSILTILSAHLRKVREILQNSNVGGAHHILNHEELVQDHVAITKMYFDLSPYGSINGIEYLKQDGIPHDREVGKQFDKNYFKTSLRFDDSGQLTYKTEGYRDRWISDTSVKNWLERYGDTDPQMFFEIMREIVRSNDQVYNPLPWTYQERNSLRYRTRRLIDHGTK